MGCLFYKKNSRIEKGNQIICIFNYFVQNKLYVYEERFVSIEAYAILLLTK